MYDLANVKEMAMRAGDENSKAKHQQVEKQRKWMSLHKLLYLPGSHCLHLLN